MHIHFEKIIFFGAGGGLLGVLILTIAANTLKNRGIEKTIDEMYHESKPTFLKKIFWIFFIAVISAALVAFLIWRPKIR